MRRVRQGLLSGAHAAGAPDDVTQGLACAGLAGAEEDLPNHPLQPRGELRRLGQLVDEPLTAEPFRHVSRALVKFSVSRTIPHNATVFCALCHQLFVPVVPEYSHVYAVISCRTLNLHL